MKLLFFLLPKNFVSWLFGQVMSVRLPGVLGRMSVRLFCRVVGADPTEAGREIHHYLSIADFFVRDLKDGLRKVESGLVAPVDGALRGCGDVVSGKVEQIKGRSYEISKLLGSEDRARVFGRGAYFNFYLAPSDYHHIHSPIRGRIVETTYIPGTLWPVNDWSVNAIDGLFCRNERVVTYIECELGMVAVVMVGATNVGKIKVAYDDLITNTFASAIGIERKKVLNRRYDIPIPTALGARLGTFCLGSTVVLLVERSDLIEVVRAEGPDNPKVKYGERIARLLGKAA